MKLVFVGWGAIAKTAAKLINSPDIEIVGVASRGNGILEGVPIGATVFRDPGELASLDADVVAEAAGREAVGPWGTAALSCGGDFIVSSVSAFADAALLESMRACATRNRAQVQIQPGALAGVDALCGAKLMGIDTVEHRIVKPPNAWLGTPAESLCDLEGLSVATDFFDASATEAAQAFPKNANVAMTTALAGIGPDRTRITLVADPAATTNRHELRAQGPFGELDVTIANNPLPANPKSSAMAALSLARAIQNRATPIAI